MPCDLRFYLPAMAGGSTEKGVGGTGWGREEGQLQTGETCMLQEFGVLGFGIPLKWIPRWRTKAEPSYLVGMGQ